jgi:hypothetical protein
MLTYNWKLNSLKKTSAANLSNVVIGTTWTLTGTDADNYSGTFSGATPFKVAELDPSSFIDYNSLTEDIVLGWVQAVVVGSYKDHIDEQINKQIRDKKNPVEEATGNNLPWIVS